MMHLVGAADWLATCAGKAKVPGWIPAVSYVQR